MQEISFEFKEKSTNFKISGSGRYFGYEQFDHSRLRSYSKGELIYIVSNLYAKVERLEAEVLALSAQLNGKKIEEVNKTANQPTSKMAEFEKDKAKKKRKRKKTREKRAGSGNQAKREPDPTAL